MTDVNKKWVIATDTWINGKPVSAGTVLELNPQDRGDLKTLNDLAMHERILPASPENTARFAKPAKK